MHSHQNIEHIRADIAETKSHINATLEELDARRDAMKDWREAVRNYPFASVGVAMLAGILLSGNLVHVIKPPRPVANQLLWSLISAALIRQTSTPSGYPRLRFP